MRGRSSRLPPAMTSEPAITRRDVGFRSERGPILIALMVVTGLIAIDSTILATAVTSVVDDLGGFSSFPWLFSVYLLAQAVSVPIYAKLADTVGRRPILLVGIGLFFLGSVLSGLAPTMTLLIVFRAVQGLGAGALLPISITIAGDIYTTAERAKAQGYLASVWAISSVVGPTLGGVFSEFVSWRWIFFVNVPLCVLAVVLIVRNYHETAQRTRHRIDVAGGITLTIGLTALLLALLEGGEAWAWTAWQSLLVFAVAVVFLVVAVIVELRAPEPILPLRMFRRRLVLSTTLVSAGVGAVLIGLTSYVPNYLERTAGASPLVAGLAVAALTLGWPLAASNAGRLYLRFGFRPTVLVGTVVAALSAALLLSITATDSILLVAGACLLIGVGLGLSATPSLIAAQSSVGYAERGVVTGANMFSRSIGSAVGVAVFGAIANAVLAGRGSAAATNSASSAVFLGVLVAGVLTVGAAALMPPVRAEHAVAAAPAPEPA
jgi:EmrB/QacA subfamily drug resistance transporter